MHESYQIKDSYFLNPPADYLFKDSYPEFKEKLEEFKIVITNQVNQNEGISYYKFGDGDYHFLKKNPIGSAKPGNRALSKKFSKIDHEKFLEGSRHNDFYMCEIIKQNKHYFNELFQREFNFPAEFVYGLLANKWILKNFKNEIGIIGAKEKIELIKNLIKKPAYKKFLGIDQFQDYISIPQKFACDDLDKTKEIIANQLTNSSSKIFLYGVGHVKSGISHLLPTYKKAVYLDVGSGIDAIAGIIDRKRPYFFNWKNHRLNNDEIYKNIDYLSFNFDGSEVIV